MIGTTFLSERNAVGRREQFLLCLFWTFVWGLAAHAFIFFNLHYNHDSIIIADNIYSNAFDLTLGRYLSPVYKFIRGYISATWLIGMLALLYIAVSSFLICDIFDINSAAAISLISGFFSANANMIVLNVSYTTCCDTFMFSNLCATLAGWCVVKEKRNFLGILMSSVALMISLAIYQAYVGVFCLIVFVYVFYSLISLKADDVSDISLLIGKAVVVLIIAAISYKLGMKIVLQMYKLKQNNYLNWDVICDIQSVPNAFAKCYNVFFYNYSHAPFHPRITSLIHILLLVFVMGNVFYIVLNRVCNKKNNLITLFIIFLVAFTPFVVNIVNFITRFQRNNELTYVSFNLLYIVPLFFCIKWSFMKKIIYAMYVVLVFFNVSSANQVYTKKKLVYDSTGHIVNRILMMTNLVDGYVEGETPVVLIGDLGRNKLFNKNYEEFNNFNSVTLSSPNSAITYFSTFGGFIKVMNTRVNILSSQDVDSLIPIYFEEFDKIPAFPAKDCCRMIDGKMVVKLSEVDLPKYCKELTLPDYPIVDADVNFCIDNEDVSASSSYLRGWAYHENDICRVIVADGERYWETNLEQRPDVQKAFDLDNDKQGFTATIPAKLDGYSLYLINDEKKEIYKNR